MRCALQHILMYFVSYTCSHFVIVSLPSPPHRTSTPRFLIVLRCIYIPVSLVIPRGLVFQLLFVLLVSREVSLVHVVALELDGR